MAQSPIAPEPLPTCDQCCKSYQRRDLLLRHRRRCQGPTKPGTRRKACDACVTAKTKCCYSQPICSRCSKRGIQCQYFNSSDTPVNQSERGDPKSVSQSPSAVASPTPGRRSSDEYVSIITDHGDLLNWAEPGMPFHFESFDVAMSDAMLSGLNAADSAMPTPFTQTFMACPQPNEDAFLSMPSTAWTMSVPAPSSDEATDPASSIGSPSDSYTLLQTISEYPSYLLKEATSSPFLHHTFFNDRDSDMTSLPLTSMAICYGHMMNARDGNRFARKAMDAEQQRLIEAFPTYKCVRQWDALHAMLLHEILELRQSLGDEVEDWKFKPRRKGLRSPFLIKMAQCYASSYPELCNNDTNLFSDPNTTPFASVKSPWARWKLMETARRTLFLVNMVNFFSYYDQVTGKQLPYYEALDDNLMLNLPLPCSHAAWLARDEYEWRQAMQSQPPSTSINTLSRRLSTHDHDSAMSTKDTLKSFLAAFPKDTLQLMLGQNVGFDNSDSLRATIILCGSEQFASPV